jgi:hypothetical protein
MEMLLEDDQVLRFAQDDNHFLEGEVCGRK